MYTEQIKSGEPYNVLKKCVSISILDFVLFPEEDEFYSCFHIREDTRNFLYTDKMEFHVIELPKLPQGLKDEKDDILLRAKFISSERKEDFEMLATKNIYIQSAYQTLQAISQDDQKDIAKNMLTVGLPVDIITQTTGLSLTQIEQLSKEGTD